MVMVGYLEDALKEESEESMKKAAVANQIDAQKAAAKAAIEDKLVEKKRELFQSIFDYNVRNGMDRSTAYAYSEHAAGLYAVELQKEQKAKPKTKAQSMLGSLKASIFGKDDEPNPDEIMDKSYYSQQKQILQKNMQQQMMGRSTGYSGLSTGISHPAANVAQQAQNQVTITTTQHHNGSSSTFRYPNGQPMTINGMPATGGGVVGGGGGNGNGNGNGVYYNMHVDQDIHINLEGDLPSVYNVDRAKKIAMNDSVPVHLHLTEEHARLHGGPWDEVGRNIFAGGSFPKGTMGVRDNIKYVYSYQLTTPSLDKLAILIYNKPLKLLAKAQQGHIAVLFLEIALEVRMT